MGRRGGAPWEEHLLWSRLVLARKEREAKEKYFLPPVDVLCLTNNGAIWKRNINYIGRPGSAPPSIRTKCGLERRARALEFPVV